MKSGFRTKSKTASQTAQIEAPSHVYLYQGSTEHYCNGTAFLSPNSGFLPKHPLPFLPYPYSDWHHLAQQLPSFCKTNQWLSLVSQLPDLSVDHLPDEHLLRANIAVGAIAHAILHLGHMQVPEALMEPWKEIAVRLGRPMPSLLSLDYALYNIELKPVPIRASTFSSPFRASPFSESDSSCMEDLDSGADSDECQGSKCLSLSEIRYSIAITGSLAEIMHIERIYSTEKAAGSLPGIVVVAHQAVLNQDHSSLRQALIDIIVVIEKMTFAFSSSDPRPLSLNFMDHVEWGRSMDIAASPVVEGEKSGSGLLFPSMHLLDAFFSRNKYGSEMGRLAKKDRPCLPELHLGFLRAVEKVSVLDYILSEARNDQKELLYVFQRALGAFAGQGGFLERHRIRLTGYLEMMFKAGRKATGNGLGASMSWESRVWRRINNAMLQSMHERIGANQGWYDEAVVQSCHALSERLDTFQITINTNAALVYQPGDLVAIRAQNTDDLIWETLSALETCADCMLLVTDKEWIRELSDRGTIPSGETKSATTRLGDFLRFAALQPLDSELGSRLARSMFAVNPAVVEYLNRTKASNVPISLQMLRETGSFSAKHLVPHLDQILRPLAPRCYSIASNMSNTPNSLEIVVRRVQYQARANLPLEAVLPARTSGSVLFRSSATNPVVHPRSHPSLATLGENNECSGHSFHKQWRCSEDFVSRACRAFQDLFKRPSAKMSATAVSNSRIIKFNKSVQEKPSVELRGVSSSFLSGIPVGTKLSARIIPELEFHMPLDREVPIIMIALGTGVAPFLSFIKELAFRRRICGRRRLNAWLILGAQSRDSVPFIEAIEEAFCETKVVDLSIALSREDLDLDEKASSKRLVFCPGSRKRITDLIRDSMELQNRFWDMISAGGHVYVCGQPDLEPLARGMVASVVRKCCPIARSISSQGAEIQAQKYVEDYADRIMANKRLHVDCYSSGRPRTMKRIFAYSEVARHRRVTSCWSIFKGGVYDLTRYLNVHPGGPKILLDKAGRDMTDDFNVSHGIGNVRVQAMMDPYKIGSLQRFRISIGNEKIGRFMDEWSVPLLHDVLERRSVFLLSWNNFNGLQEPLAFKSWKSQYSSDAQVAELCQRFWQEFEPGMFKAITDSLHGDRIGRLVAGFGEEFVNIRFPDVSKVVAELNAIRARSLGGRTDSQPVSYSNGSAFSFFSQCAYFMEGYCNMAIEVQRTVEATIGKLPNCKDFELYRSIVDLMNKILEVIKRGIEQMFKVIPSACLGQKQRAEDICSDDSLSIR